MDKNVLEFRRTVQGNILKAFGGGMSFRKPYMSTTLKTVS